ncbi:hypothetical protein HK102_005410 [Quaeritorhiza haematococci]|nr:hypothetical protein HK102_005410 [Quaeritorhiza haematococci]
MEKLGHLAAQRAQHQEDEETEEAEGAEEEQMDTMSQKRDMIEFEVRPRRTHQTIKRIRIRIDKCFATPSYSRDGDLLILDMPLFAVFKRASTSKVKKIPPLPKDRSCPGFKIKIDDELVAIPCPWKSIRDATNSYYGSTQFTLCFGCKKCDNNLLYNPHSRQAAAETKVGFITYKARSCRYFDDKGSSLVRRYSRLLSGYDLVGPLDELSNLPTVLRSYLAMEDNGNMWVWQRWDVTKGRDDDEQDGAHFNQFSNSNRETIRELLEEDIIKHSNPSIALPTTWDPSTTPVPTSPSPLPASGPIDEDFKDYEEWIAIHLDHVGRDGRIVRGKWFNNEARKRNPRPVTVTADDLRELYRQNGGSVDRIFGVKGSWKSSHKLLLTIDKIDHRKGYEKGNLVIVLHRCNDARFIYHWHDFLRWRDGILCHWRNGPPHGWPTI